MSTDTICVIGLGDMGGAVAAHLAESGYEVAGYDPDGDARARAAQAGVRTAESVREAVGGAGVIATSLPNSAVVRAVWLGEDGVTAHARKDSFVVELSTIDPATMVEVAAEGRSAGLRVVDCAVSGGPAEARGGRLSLIVGGAPEDVEDITPLLKAIGTDLFTTGDVGTAKTVKLVNNMMSLGNLLVAAEAFTVGVRAGVEPRRLFDVLSLTGGRSNQFVKRFPMALDGDFASRFSMRLGEKDLTLGLELARATGTPTPTTSVTRDLYSIAVAEGLGDKDIVALVELFERWSTAPAAPARPTESPTGSKEHP